MFHDVVADRQDIQVPQLEGPDSVCCGTDNGLFVHIEAGVDDLGIPRNGLVGFQNSVERGVRSLRYGLRTGRAVNVDRGGGLFFAAFGDVVGDGHILCGVL